MDQVTRSVLFFLAGVILIVIGVLNHLKRKRLFETGVKVDGYLENIAFRSGDQLELTIKFETLKKQQKYIKHQVYAPSAYKIGEPIAVIYNPNNPDKFIIDEGPYKPNGTYAIYGGAVLIMVSVIALMTALR